MNRMLEAFKKPLVLPNFDKLLQFTQIDTALKSDMNRMLESFTKSQQDIDRALEAFKKHLLFDRDRALELRKASHATGFRNAGRPHARIQLPPGIRIAALLRWVCS